MALSAEVAVCNIERGVNIRVVLRNPTLRVGTLERRLVGAVALFSATMACLRGVCGIHRVHTNPFLGGLVLDLSVHLHKAPSVKAAVHERAVVHVLADVRQVFEDQHGILELVGVGDGHQCDRVEYVVNLSPERIAVTLCDTFASTFLKASSRCEVRLTELSNLFAFVVPEVGCSRGAVARSHAIWLPIRHSLMTALVTVTHR